MKQNEVTAKETAGLDVSISLNRNTSWNMPRYHFHHAYEVYLSLSDNINFFVSDRIYNISRGDLLVFNSSELHRSIAPGNTEYERYVLYFDPDFVKPLSTLSTDLLDCFINRPDSFTHCVHLTESQLDKLLHKFHSLEYYSANDAYGGDVYKRIILADILLFINSLFRTPDNKIASYIDKDFKKVTPVMQHIQHNLDKSLSLEYLSRKFYISKSHLCTLFKKVSGFTINEYIVQQRILRAKELLKKDLPVTQVCELTGFNNLSHFIRTFTRTTGISPKQYAIRARNRVSQKVNISESLTSNPSNTLDFTVISPI
jgi:AraC-like DNA-binding protein